jgi:hypothetical protein
MENYNKIVKSDSVICYYLNGKLHRLDGPAFERSDGYKSWYQNGKRHRIDGPAVDWSDGTKEWWIKGELMKCDSQSEFERLIKLKLFW